MTFQWLKDFKWLSLFQGQSPDLAYQQERIRLMERNVGLPAKCAVVIVLFYYLFFSRWFEDVIGPRQAVDAPPREFALEIIRRAFLIYVALNAGAASLLLGMRQIPFNVVKNIASAAILLDALLVSALTLVTGGFDSILYWVFIGLIIRTAISIPVAPRQFVLNSIVTGLYVAAGLFDVVIADWEIRMMDDVTRMAVEEGLIEAAPGTKAEPFFLRIVLLFLTTFCCYGVQALFEKQRLVEEEAREFNTRQEQLQAAGRLAAEIAHQLKNPLGIINNAAFTLQRLAKDGPVVAQQVSIIREEVERSDRIITELMGYAQLSEGKVEKVQLVDELDRAIEQVFPRGSGYQVEVFRDFQPGLPTLMAQRGHLSEVFINILQNAREAMNGVGSIHMTASSAPDFHVKVTISDNGPGIPKDKLGNIFQPYFTTKEKGTGLGLAIVKHNTELYNGTVTVESELGKGTTFTILLPAKTLIRFRR